MGQEIPKERSHGEWSSHGDRGSFAAGRKHLTAAGEYYLNEFDQEYEKRGVAFVRYADDSAPRRRVQAA